MRTRSQWFPRTQHRRWLAYSSRLLQTHETPACSAAAGTSASTGTHKGPPLRRGREAAITHPCWPGRQPAQRQGLGNAQAWLRPLASPLFTALPQSQKAFKTHFMEDQGLG